MKTLLDDEISNPTSLLYQLELHLSNVMKWHCLYYVMLPTYMSRRWLLRVKHMVVPRFLHVWTSSWKYIMIYIYVIVSIHIMVIKNAHCRSLARSMCDALTLLILFQHVSKSSPIRGNGDIFYTLCSYE